MIGSSVASNVLAGAVLALLVVGAVYALFVGLRARREAGAAAEENARLQALLAGAPAQAMIVRADGRIDLPQRLADWLGLPGSARYLADLSAPGSGLDAADVAALTHDVMAAQKAGRGFVRALRPQGSSRALIVQGQRAPAAMGAAGGVVLWFFDATESEGEIGRLSEDVADARAAFEALTGLIEAAPLPMWYRGPDLRLAMVNTAYVHAVEAGDGEEAVRRGMELVEGAGVGGPLQGAAVARDTGKPQIHNVPATIRGDRRMLQVHDVPLPTGGVAGFAVDIEDLEQARSGMKRFAEAQRGMLDRLSAGVAQFGSDRGLVFCNQPFRRMFAMRTEWLADRPEFERVLERMREANRLPEVRDFPGWKAERRDWFVAPEGATEENWHLPGGTHLRVVAQTLPDGGLLLIFEDRTEQVQIASARDTLLRVRTATFDNLFEALGVFAADGRLQLWNNKLRAIWGFEEEFLAGHPRVDAFAEAVAPKLATPNRAALIPELVRSATVDRQQRGGRVALADGRHFEFAAVPLPDGNALFTMLDISDSRRAEQALRERNTALEQADRVKTAFVANMSYELRTPLTSISGFAEMLGEGYAGKLTREAHGYVEAILESVARLSLLIDEVLDLTQNEGEAVEMGDVDLAAIARAAAAEIQPLAKRKGLEFAVEVARSTGRVRGDARRLRQVVEHLLRHAVAGTNEGGRILLHADGTATRARLVVSDDGGGMSAEAVAHAFDKFAGAGSGGTEGGERVLELGLPLARQFVEAHGGTIELVSEPGEGTLLTVALPRR